LLDRSVEIRCHVNFMAREVVEGGRVRLGARRRKYRLYSGVDSGSEKGKVKRTCDFITKKTKIFCLIVCASTNNRATAAVV
jgi:hypothetical protein